MKDGLGLGSSPETTWERQTHVIAPGDVLLGISTSGNARNVAYAAQTARALGLTVIGLTGESGGHLADLADITIRVPAGRTDRVQELHVQCYHTLCDMLERETFAKEIE